MFTSVFFWLLIYAFWHCWNHLDYISPFYRKNFLYRLCLFCFQHLDLRIIFHLFNQRSKCSVGGLLDWTSNGKDSLLENLYLLPRKYPLFIPLTLAVHGYCLFFTLLKHHKSLLFLLRLIFIYLFVFVYAFVWLSVTCMRVPQKIA